MASQRKSPMDHPVVVTFLILAAMMRSVPYAGAAVAFLLALVFSIAYFDGWRQPLEVAALFGRGRSSSSDLEPVIYGKTTGVALPAAGCSGFLDVASGCWARCFRRHTTLCLAVLGCVAGVAASGTLRRPHAAECLDRILAHSSCALVNIEGTVSPMQLASVSAQSSPAMVILSHLPPEALAQARYQVRRLRLAVRQRCRSWWGAGARPAATRRPRGSPESGPRTWPSRWPMPATRSWPGPLPRFR